MLNGVQSDHEENFLTRKFTRKEEGSITGADWLWCIGEPGSWITFAVQAKIVNINTGRVNYLHYRGGEQYSMLINFSKQFGFIPKYSIYAKVEKEIELFSKGVPDLKNIPAIQWSFTAISPKYIKHLSTPNERHISNVLQFAVPWTYVFCAENYRNVTLAEVIVSNLENVFWSFDNEYRQRRKQNPRFSYEHKVWENPQPSKMISDSIPLPVLYLMTQKSFPHRVPISNVSVFSSLPVYHALDVELAKIENSRQWKNFPRVFEQKVEKIQNSERTNIILGRRW